MKTYAETQGKAPFDWNAFLVKESYSYTEVEHAHYLSREWVTCACGNQCDIIPRNYQGMPEDKILQHYGKEFVKFLSLMINKYFSKEDFNIGKKLAKQTLHAIESRSQEIINDLKNKK